MTTILVVDDEPLNIELIKRYLAKSDFEFVSGSDGIEAWVLLQALHDKIDVVLLDRNMPNMDGLQLMEKIKSDPKTASIPVIMQTAATEPKEISEGINAGVYYYLAKPYQKELLLSIVDAALRDYRQQKILNEQLQQQKTLLSYIERSELSFRTLQDAETLAPILASFFPQPEIVLLGISELLINAVEHGNAGISYNEKTDLNHNGTWRQEVNRRIDADENKYKRVHVCYEKTDDKAYISIEDEGSGFEWLQYMQISPERASNNHGRGIAMSNLMSFDTLEYQGAGNKVVCSVLLVKS